MQSYIQRHKILILHASFWCVYFSFFYYQISFSKNGKERDFLELLGDAGFQVLSMMFIAYLNYFYFLPRFLRRNAPDDHSLRRGNLLRPTAFGNVSTGIAIKR